MKDSIPLALCLVAACSTIVAQTHEFKNYYINHTGYAVLFPADPGTAEVSLSEDELEVYSAEVDFGGDRYGLVMVLLEDNFLNSDTGILQSLLTSYMDLLKLSYDVTSGIGYQTGQKHPQNKKATGILDFWEDETGAQWAVKGWIDNDVLAVLYVHSTTPQDMRVPYEFLDGFRFQDKKIKPVLIQPAPKMKKLK